MRHASENRSNRWQLVVALACVVAAVTALSATSRGVGLSPDSLQYLSAAESAAGGNGLTAFAWDGEPTPLTHFPPGYPMLLAAGARVGLPLQDFARWMNGGLFAFTVFLIAIIARRAEPESVWVAPATAWLSATNPDLVNTHSMAWSEPLYVALTLGGALALMKAIDHRSMHMLLLAVAAAAAASLVRYIGVANIMLSAIAVMLWWPAPSWRRMSRGCVIGMLAAAPLAVVLASATSGSDATIGNRQLGWHPLGGSDLRLAVVVASKWIDPLRDADYLSVVWFSALGVLLGAVIVFRRLHFPRQAAPRAGLGVTRVLLLYAAAYLTVFVLTMVVADAQTGFEPRLVVPLLPVVIIVGAAWLARQWYHAGRVRFAVAGILVLLLSGNLMRIVPWFRDARSDGIALRRLEPDAKALVEAARRLPPGANLYSNDPYFLRVHTNRMVSGVPRERDPSSLASNPRHGRQVQGICDGAVVRPTFLVLFDNPVSPDPTANADIARKGGDTERFPGGVIVRVRPQCAL